MWSLQLRENDDFNVEEKGSKLIEQQRLQLIWRKDMEREIRKGESDSSEETLPGRVKETRLKILRGQVVVIIKGREMNVRLDWTR